MNLGRRAFAGVREWKVRFFLIVSYLFRAVSFTVSLDFDAKDVSCLFCCVYKPVDATGVRSSSQVRQLVYGVSPFSHASVT